MLRRMSRIFAIVALARPASSTVTATTTLPERPGQLGRTTAIELSNDPYPAASAEVRAATPAIEGIGCGPDRAVKSAGHLRRPAEHSIESADRLLQGESSGVHYSAIAEADGRRLEGESPGVRIYDALLAIFGAITVFIALAIVCDDYLCPAIEEICERYGIPDDIAGASLMALGSSAPEILINVSAVIVGKIETSLGAVLGSGMIAFGLIPPLVAWSTPQPSAAEPGPAKWGKTLMTLTTYPLLRDAVAYGLTLVLLLVCVSDGAVQLGDSASLVSVYVAYLLVIIWPYMRRRCMGGEQQAGEVERHQLENRFVSLLDDGEGEMEGGESSARRRQSPDTAAAAAAGAVDSSIISCFEADPATEAKDADNDDDDDDDGCLNNRLFRTVAWPMQVVFRRTMPFPPEIGSRSSVPTWKVWGAFWLSIVYVAIFANFALFTAEDAAIALALDKVTAGATLLAFGAQIPDVIGSMSMAKSGMSDGAVANAAGSQVINVALGVGLPFFLLTLSSGDPVRLPTEGIGPLAICVFIVLLAYLVSILPIPSWFKGELPLSVATMTHGRAVALFGVTVVVYSTFVLMQVFSAHAG